MIYSERAQAATDLHIITFKKYCDIKIILIIFYFIFSPLSRPFAQVKSTRQATTPTLSPTFHSQHLEVISRYFINLANF